MGTDCTERGPAGHLFSLQVIEDPNINGWRKLPLTTILERLAEKGNELAIKALSHVAQELRNVRSIEKLLRRLRNKHDSTRYSKSAKAARLEVVLEIQSCLKEYD